jgi:hypothetical protein
MVTVYFWIDGEGFDPDDFQSGLAVDLRGTVESRKRMVDGRVERYGRNWKSEVRTPVSDEPEEELVRLLSRYGAELVRARAKNATRIMAEIVSEYGSLEDIGGFYFSAETIRLLAEFGVSVDIDVVRRIT